jgi:hypothetical protein
MASKETERKNGLRDVCVGVKLPRGIFRYCHFFLLSFFNTAKKKNESAKLEFIVTYEEIIALITDTRQQNKNFFQFRFVNHLPKFKVSNLDRDSFEFQIYDHHHHLFSSRNRIASLM